MDRLEEAVRDGKRAAILLGDPLLKRSFEQLEHDYFTAWIATKPGQIGEREALWQAYQIVGKVRNHLEMAINDGVVADAEIQEIRKFGEKRKFLGVA